MASLPHISAPPCFSAVSTTSIRGAVAEDVFWKPNGVSQLSRYKGEECGVTELFSTRETWHTRSPWKMLFREHHGFYCMTFCSNIRKTDASLQLHERTKLTSTNALLDSPRFMFRILTFFRKRQNKLAKKHPIFHKAAFATYQALTNNYNYGIQSYLRRIRLKKHRGDEKKDEGAEYMLYYKKWTDRFVFSSFLTDPLNVEKWWL